MSNSLTLNYGGQLYVLESTPEANAVGGSRVDVFEEDDGTDSLRAHGIERPANVHPRRCSDASDIVLGRPSDLIYPYALPTQFRTMNR